MIYAPLLQFGSGLIDAVAISYQRKYNKLHRSIYGLSYDLYILSFVGSSLSIYCTLSYLWSPLLRTQLSKRYPLFYPLDDKKGIPLSFILLIKDFFISGSSLVLLRQLIVYRATKHIHQSISKFCISVLIASAIFGILTYTFACANLPHTNSGTYGVFYLEHISYTWIIANTLIAVKFIPQLSLNWFGMSTSGLSSKFVIICFANKLLYLIIWAFLPENEEFYRVPFNWTPLPVPLFELITIAGILYQAQILYLRRHPHLPKGKAR